MKLSKIGMRTIKTVIAVILTLIIADFLNLNSPILAGIAAIMTIETTVSETFISGKNRMYGTVLGAVVGLIITFIAPKNYIVVGIGLIVIISICNTFEWEKAVRMSMIVFLVIILDYEEGYRLTYALNRTFDTFLGVIVGTSINYFLRPPKVEVNLGEAINDMYLEVKNILENLIWKEEQVRTEDLRNRITEIHENYKALSEEIKYNIHLQESIVDYRNLFNLFERVQNHLIVMSPIIKEINIDRQNKEGLEKMFSREVPEKEDIQNLDRNMIYNYHLDKVIDILNSIEDILKRQNK